MEDLKDRVRELTDGMKGRITDMIALRRTSKHATGARAGLARGHLENILSGRRQTVTAETLLGIALALNVTTDWLLTGEGPLERYVPPATPANSEPLREHLLQRGERAVGAMKKGQAAKRPRRRS